MPVPETKYNTRAAARYLGVATGTLAAGRTAADPKKQLPIPFEKDGRHVWYRREDLDAYRASKAEETATVEKTEEEDRAVRELKERIRKTEEELREACAARGAARDEAGTAKREAAKWRRVSERLVGALVNAREIVDDALEDARGTK